MVLSVGKPLIVMEHFCHMEKHDVSPNIENAEILFLCFKKFYSQKKKGL
jgi:hypothetical protein